MKWDRHIIIFIGCFLSGLMIPARLIGNQAEGTLQVHLPRQITIPQSVVLLGDVCVIRGEDSMVAQANQIGLGRITLPGQTLVIDRSLVLSRLACNGIPGHQVTVTGAEQVKVRKNQQIIKGDDIIAYAQDYLKENPQVPHQCVLRATRCPPDISLGSSHDVTLLPQLTKRMASGYLQVKITAVAHGKELTHRDVVFQIKYPCRKVVTLCDIAQGTPITPDNVKIEHILGDQPEPVGWITPYGQIAKRRIPANARIRPDWIGTAPSNLVIKRNESVMIRINRPGLLITAFGKCLEDGHVGEIVKVKNVDSSRIILCKVKADGTVEPLF